MLLVGVHQDVGHGSVDIVVMLRRLPVGFLMWGRIRLKDLSSLSATRRFRDGAVVRLWSACEEFTVLQKRERGTTLSTELLRLVLNTAKFSDKITLTMAFIR